MGYVSPRLIASRGIDVSANMKSGNVMVKKTSSALGPVSYFIALDVEVSERNAEQSMASDGVNINEYV